MSLGDQLLLKDSDLCHVATPQFVSMAAMTVHFQQSSNSPPAYVTQRLSSQLHSPSSVVSVLLNQKYKPDILLMITDSLHTFVVADPWVDISTLDVPYILRYKSQHVLVGR